MLKSGFFGSKLDYHFANSKFGYRAMMQEPHCLNTSILDCSVTFTVDKDICIHGIEVPSQVTEANENLELPMLQNLAVQAGNQPNNNNNAAGASTEYNELLYAHLLDADGNRLTYTHFTAKVSFAIWVFLLICRKFSI